MKNTYIVTGATGFVGNNLVKQLTERGETVIALARDEKKAALALKNTPAKIVYTGLDETAIDETVAGAKSADTRVIVIHTASVVYLGNEKDKLKQMHAVNIESVKHIIKTCAKYGARLVYVSSVHALKPDRNTTVETSGLAVGHSHGHYAKTKAEATRMVMEAVASRGLDAVIVYPSAIIGPDDYTGTHLTQMIDDFAKGRFPAAIGGGYDFVDVRDVAAGIITAAATKACSGETYLLTNRYCSVRELFTILNSLGVGPQIKRTLPRWLAYMACPFIVLDAKLNGTRPLCTRYSLGTLAGGDNFSHAKAAKHLHYKPRDLRESLRDTVEFIKTLDANKTAEFIKTLDVNK